MKIIKTYDRSDALLYVDPPYFKAEKHYEGFGQDDHKRLISCLSTVKGKFVLSYNDAPEIREMYTGFNIHEVERSNSLAQKPALQGANYYKFPRIVHKLNLTLLFDFFL